MYISTHSSGTLHTQSFESSPVFGRRIQGYNFCSCQMIWLLCLPFKRRETYCFSLIFFFCFFSAKLVRTITFLSFQIGQLYLVCRCMIIRWCVAYCNDIKTRKNCFRYLKLMSPLNAAICTTISYTLWVEWYYLIFFIWPWGQRSRSHKGHYGTRTPPYGHAPTYQISLTYLLLLLLSEACPNHNFFVFPDRSIIFGM
jgi:hypothetical protein